LTGRRPQALTARNGYKIFNENPWMSTFQPVSAKAGFLSAIICSVDPCLSITGTTRPRQAVFIKVEVSHRVLEKVEKRKRKNEEALKARGALALAACLAAAKALAAAAAEKGEE
jgi:hypothetical protein